MKCPACRSEHTHVIDVRKKADFENRRRRECLSCLTRWSTIESVVLGSIDGEYLKKNAREREGDVMISALIQRFEQVGVVECPAGEWRRFQTALNVRDYEHYCYWDNDRKVYVFTSEGVL